MTFLSCDLTELGADVLKSKRNSGIILDSSLSILQAPTASHLTLFHLLLSIFTTSLDLQRLPVPL